MALAYAGWFWLCLGAFVIPAWILAVALPGERARWRAVSAVARGFFLAARIRLEVDGREHLGGAPRVVVLNHASYLDSLALVASLPPGFSIVAKRELDSNLLLRRALRRLGLTFVERFDPQRAAAELGALEEELGRGRSLVVFPEGTNRRAPGLFPFHEGAFLAAAHRGAPVVPGGIRGTRTILRADQWFPRPGAITFAFGPPLTPEGPTWEDALALRDRARREVSDASGEPLV
jgi:1-acyl-sn-glycerol-3-phosphate acyltransferase